MIQFDLRNANDFHMERSDILVNSIPRDWSRLKVFADDIINMTEKIEICFGNGKKHCGKGENASYQLFFLFPLSMVFKRLLFQAI